MIDIFGIIKDLFDNGITVHGNKIEFGFRNGIKNEEVFALKPAFIRDINTLTEQEYVIYLSYSDVINTAITELYKDEYYPVSLIVTNFSIDNTEDVTGNLISIVNEIEYLVTWYNQLPDREVVFDPITVNRLVGASEFNLNLSARRNGVSLII